MKHIVLSGRLTAPPEVKCVGEQQVKLAKFRIANNDNDKETGEFFDVVAWDRQADFTENHLEKGQRIVLSGTFDNEVYQDKEGNRRTHFSITANRIEFA